MAMIKQAARVARRGKRVARPSEALTEVGQRDRRARRADLESARSYTQALNSVRLAAMQGRPLPPVADLIDIEGAAPPHKLFEDLDFMGYVWMDGNVAAVLEAFIRAPPRYIASHAPTFVKEVRRWDNRAHLRGTTAHKLLTLYTVLGDSKSLQALWDQLGEEGVQTEGAYRAAIRGCLLTKNIEEAQAWVDHMKNADVEMSFCIEELLAMLYAETASFEELDRLVRTSASGMAVLTPDVLENLVTMCVDNFMYARALDVIEEALGRGVLAYVEGGKATGYRRAVWQCLFNLDSPAQVRRGLDIVRLLIGRDASVALMPEPTPGQMAVHVRYIAPYDALMRSAITLGLFDHAIELFDLVDAAGIKCQLHPDNCTGIIALATQAIASAASNADSDKHHTAIIRSITHLHRAAISPTFATLLHLQMAVDSSWHTHDVQSAIVSYCPNFEERLLYYLPGFQEFRLTHRAVGGKAGAAALLKPFASVVVPDASYLMSAATQFTREAQAAGASAGFVVPFSVLSGLQVVGDEMREDTVVEGDGPGVDNPADAALKTLGDFLSTRAAPQGETIAAHENVKVLGMFEQRAVATLHGQPADTFDIFADEDKLVAAVAGLAAATPAHTRFEVRTASLDSHAEYSRTLAALPAALADRITLLCTAPPARAGAA